MKKFEGLGYTDAEGVVWERDKDGGVILNFIAHLAHRFGGWLFDISWNYTLWTEWKGSQEDENVQS